MNVALLEENRRVLSDGSEIVLRPLEPSDAELLRDLFDEIGEDTRRRRFLTPVRALTVTELRRLTSVDHRDHEGLVALSVAEGRLIGFARFVRSVADPATAEAAVVVGDSWLVGGVGTTLAEALVAHAQKLRVRRLSMKIARDHVAVLRLMDRVIESGEKGQPAGEVVNQLTRNPLSRPLASA